MNKNSLVLYSLLLLVSLVSTSVMLAFTGATHVYSLEVGSYSSEMTGRWTMFFEGLVYLVLFLYSLKSVGADTLFFIVYSIVSFTIFGLDMNLANQAKTLQQMNTDVNVITALCVIRYLLAGYLGYKIYVCSL